MQFTGEQERSIDEQYRVVMPPKIKDGLEGKKFIISCMPGDCCIKLYNTAVWEKLTEEHLFIDNGVDKIKLQRYIYKNSAECELDGQNRFKLSQKFAQRVGINHDVVFLGVGKRAEIWAKESYESDDSDENEKIAEIARGIFEY